MKLSSGQLLSVLGLIGFAAASRLLPHPPNVSPIAAIALLGGATLRRPWSFIVPAVAMFASDLVIGFDTFPVTLSVYGSFFATVLIGAWLRGRPSPWRFLTASLIGSVLFYLVTNAAVWQFSGMYPQTFDGLLLSYFYALPFFRNTLVGDLAYTVSLFLAYQYAPRLVPAFSMRRVSTRVTHALSQSL